MKIISKLLLTSASVIITGAFGFLQAQNNAPEKLHQRVYQHYEQSEIALFKPLDIRQLNWYMTQSFVVDQTTTVNAGGIELNVDTFDVIKYDRLRTDDGRVRIILPYLKHPLFLFSKNEVLAHLQEMKFINPAIQSNDCTIVTCAATWSYLNYTSLNTSIDTIVTFCSSSPGSCLQVNFTTFQLGSGTCSPTFPSDVMQIFDGPDTSSSWIGNYGPMPSTVNPGTLTSTGVSGCLTFRFITSVCTPGAPGFSATLACVPCTAPPPPGPSCNNVDFEAGTLAGWSGTVGTNQVSVWTPGINPTNHQVWNSGVDPCGGFPKVAPGGTWSAQLGNSSVGAISEQLFQRFAVTSANANFTLQYAVVLEDPGHAFFDQPFFRIEVYNDTNNLVQCGYYYVSAGQNLPGFLPCTGVSVYKPWSFIAINLAPYIGQSVTVKYTTADCSRTGHYGYAYLDCTCNPFTLGGPAGICPGQSAVLTGPSGYATYSWTLNGVPTGDTTQIVTVTDSGQYCCTVSSSNQACASSTICSHLSLYAKPVADFSYSPTSPMLFSQLPACFNNLTTISSGTIAGYAWNFGDLNLLTDTSSGISPCYTYIEHHCLKDSVLLGDTASILDTCQNYFCIWLIARSDNGCLDTAQHCIEVLPDSMIIPNVFTPNGDNKNEFFHFPNIGYKDLHCDIYNRWGNHIYSWDGAKGGWDGTTKVGPASDGTYYWVMTATKINETSATSNHGWVQLMRH